MSRPAAGVDFEIAFHQMARGYGRIKRAEPVSPGKGPVAVLA